MPKPFDWLCESCGDVVWASRMECRCGAPKPRHPIEIGPDGKFPEGTEILGQSGASQLIGSSDDGSGGHKQRHGHHGRYRDGDWICPNCGDKCFSSRTKCRFCDTARPPADQLVLVTSATALVNDGEMEVREGGKFDIITCCIEIVCWCVLFTYQNSCFLLLFSCFYYHGECCISDWPCPRCNRNVWGRHAVCLCGEPKPN